YTWKGKEPSKIFWGLKPLKGWCHSSMFQSMRMSAWWTVGHNEAQDWVANGQEIVLVPFNYQRHVGIYDRDFDNRNLSKFTDVDFLERETSSEKFKVDVEKGDVSAEVQVWDGYRSFWKKLA